MPVLAWLRAPARAWSALVVDTATVGFALWTATCHAVMLLGGNTYALTAAVAFVAGAIALLGARALWRWRVQPAPGPGDEARSQDGPEAAATTRGQPTPVPGFAPPSDTLRERIAIGVLAAIVLGLWLTNLDLLLKWGALAVFLAAAYGLGLRPSGAGAGSGATPAPDAIRVPRAEEAMLFAIALGCSWLALYCHRWRNDDCYYINLAVTIADLPNRALLSVNTIHAPLDASSDLSSVFVPYRVHSFEALGGLISFWTKIPAINVIHLGLAAVSASLIPLSLARLFRLLDPQRWFAMLLCVLCLYTFEGSSGLGYASHAIVRAFTGKSVMLSVAVPLLVHNGIAFSLAPSARRWWLLLAAQVTAVGLSSTGLWLAPLGAMLAVLVPLRADLRSLRTLGLGLLSCVYVLGLALWVHAQIVSGAIEAVPGAATAVGSWKANFGLLYWWLKKLFDTVDLANVYLVVVVVAIAVCRTALARRYLIVFCLALAIGLMNPYLPDFVRYNITGRYTGQRVLWLAPIPTAVALAFAALLPSGRGPLRAALGWVAMALALGLFFSRVPTRGVFTRDNGVDFHWPPGPKVPVDAYALDQRIARLPLGQGLVLAPEKVSWYLPTIHHHPYPLLANAKYLSANLHEERRRKRLVEMVTHYHGDLSEKQQHELTTAIDRYPIGAIVVRGSAARAHRLISIIRAHQFKRIKAPSGYQLWLRKHD